MLAFLWNKYDSRWYPCLHLPKKEVKKQTCFLLPRVFEAWPSSLKKRAVNNKNYIWRKMLSFIVSFDWQHGTRECSAVIKRMTYMKSILRLHSFGCLLGGGYPIRRQWPCLDQNRILFSSELFFVSLKKQSNL